MIPLVEIGLTYLSKSGVPPSLLCTNEYIAQCSGPNLVFTHFYKICRWGDGGKIKLSSILFLPISIIDHLQLNNPTNFLAGLV